MELLLPVSGAPEQQHGVLHGGVVAYLADNALASAGGLRLSGRIATAEMTINHVRPAAGDALVARGHALSSGRTQAVARCEVFAVSGGVERLCAAAQGAVVAAGAGSDPPAAG